MIKLLHISSSSLLAIFFLLVGNSTLSYAQNFNSEIRYFNGSGYGLDKIDQIVSMNDLTYKKDLEDTKLYYKYKDSSNEVTYQLKDKLLIGFMVTTLSKTTAENAIRNIMKDHGNPSVEDGSTMIWHTTRATCMFMQHENKYIFSISKH